MVAQATVSHYYYHVNGALSILISVVTARGITKVVICSDGLGSLFLT